MADPRSAACACRNRSTGYAPCCGIMSGCCCIPDCCPSCACHPDCPAGATSAAECGDTFCYPHATDEPTPA